MKICIYDVTVIVAFLFLLAKCNAARDKRQSDDETPVVFPVLEEIPEYSCVVADGSEGTCRPAGLCVFRVDSVRQLERGSCRMENEEIGTCCPKKAPPSRGTGPLQPGPENPVTMPDISSNDLDSAGAEGLSIVQQIDQLEIELRRKGLFLEHGTAEYYHRSLFGGKNGELVKLARDGLVGVEATVKLVRTFKLDSTQSREGLRRFSLTNTIISDTCPKPPPCPPTKYRNADGSCNNLENPTWGKAFTAYARLLPPRYHDGINAPRVSYDGGPLPSAREVSYRIVPDEDHPSRRFTSSFMLWGQFLGQDLTLTGLSTASNGEGIACCKEEIQSNAHLLHPSCLAIHIPSNDPFYAGFGETCMEFVRSIAAPREDCTFGPREQLNQVTAYIDGSMLYGSSDNESTSLRSFVGGKLKTTMLQNNEFLPLESQNKSFCFSEHPRIKCFLSGDSRTNQHTLLMAMHTIWLREHNRIASRLARLNPGWNDEILYREAKRLVSAEIQHITYSEYLPLLLGNKIMSSFKLSPKLAGYSFDYDTSLSASIINSFSTAAFRMGHTLVPSTFDLLTADGDAFSSVMLRDQYFRPNLLYRNGSFDMLVRGLAKQSAESFDKYVSNQLTNHLFRSRDAKYGLDLIAINIQRGRDHGLPGYNEWREHCGLPRIRNFEELATVMDPTSAGNFSRLYRNADDLDLYPAGISENPLPDAVLGPTFACIVAEQFRRLKQGDRFWYENGGMESSFTETQLAEIRKVTLARVLCDNADINEIQLVVFLKPARWNPVELCRSDKIQKMRLTSWKNEPVWT